LRSRALKSRRSVSRPANGRKGAAAAPVPAVEQALAERLAFERFLADLSARFVNVPGEKVDAEIQNGLRRLVEFLDVDHSSLARLTPEGTVVVLSSYAGPGIAAPLLGGFGEGLDWYVRELMQGRVVRISRLDLPPDAIHERTFAQATGVKWHVGIPVTVSGMPPCVVGLATFRRQHGFAEESIPRLRLIGEVFANALARRDSEARLRRVHAELSHVTRVSTMGQLAASIAHEINQPLCAIITNAQAALRQLSRPRPELEEVGGALRDIAADGKRAGEVVSKSHGQLRRHAPEFQPLSINDVIRDVVSLVHGEAVIRRVALRLDLHESLPAVSGDRVQLQQVVLNLVVNAIDATADVAEEPRQILLRSERSRSQVRVTVSDTGVGLTPEVASRMFDPFYTTKRNGLGMGLAINRTIVQAHGGRMWAAPNRGRGASVAFSLPGG
jgi:signal transduction histidine kinase